MDAKYLIIHMDDMGSSHAANAAGMRLFERGIVTSCSVMIPCACAVDFVRWWNENRQYDIGIHFTLTCEWENGKWPPVGARDKTESLWNPEGFMWRNNDEVLEHVNPADAYNELDAQIRLALQWGLSPSHFDRHMHTITLNKHFLSVYMRLAEKYNVTCQITKNEIPNTATSKALIKSIDYLTSIEGGTGLNLSQKRECLYKIIRNLKPGITQLTIHPVMDTPEIRYIIPDWYERYDEYRLFMEDNTVAVIKESGVIPVDYKFLNEGGCVSL